MRPNVLVLAEHFPNSIQPWLLNWLEEVIRRGGAINVVAARRMHARTPPRVTELGLDSKVSYCPLETSSERLRASLAVGRALLTGGSQARRNVARLIAAGRFLGFTEKELLKIFLRAGSIPSGRIDLVHSHTLGMSYEYLAVPTALRVPLVTTFHGLPPAGVPLPSERVTSQVFRHGDLFLVNTRFALAQLNSLGCPTSKIRILPQGTRLTDFAFSPAPLPRDGRAIILTVARLHPDKGHEFAIRAVKKLVASGMNVEYRIAGVGPQRDYLMALAISEGVDAHVHFLGFVGEEDLKRQLHAAHIFLLPSVRSRDGMHEETQGVVVQEAQASGSLVVSTRTGGIPECVRDRENAFLVEDRNADQIADMITMLLRNQAQWSRWRFLARTHVEAHFDIEKLGDDLLALYREAHDLLAEKNLG